MTFAVDSLQNTNRSVPQRRTHIARQGTDVVANVGLLALLWFAYAAVRSAAGNTSFVALENAASLLDFESALGVDVEAALQAAVVWPQAAIAANSYYLLHFPLTLAVMAISFGKSRDSIFPVIRNSIIGCTAVALAVHTFVPMAPPRMLPGFVDTGALLGPDPYALAGSGHANQFAAMPSMHVAWAILCGYAVWQLSARTAVRLAAVLHPVLTSFVVILTGHHFVADVAIGAGLAFLVLAVVTSVARPDRHMAEEHHRIAFTK